MKASEAKVGEKYLSKTGATVTKTGEKDGKKIAIGATTVNPPRPASLAALIDPLLLAGGHSVKEIAAEISRQAGDAAKDKDLEANVRARMVIYTRKGWTVAKDDKKRVKVIQPKG